MKNYTTTLIFPWNFEPKDFALGCATQARGGVGDSDLSARIKRKWKKRSRTTPYNTEHFGVHERCLFIKDRTTASS